MTKITTIKKPNFLVIGAQKSGTTWLYKFFLSRNDVYVPKKRKELAFFDVKANYANLGEEGYLKYFAEVENEVAIGEVTPGYLWVSSENQEWGSIDDFRKEIPQRVKIHLGESIKLIALLRNPIDRAISGFMHHKKMGRINDQEKMPEVWNRHGILHIGFYGAHLREWAKVFSQKNFYIATYESFFKQESKRKELCDFLGVNRLNTNRIADKIIHSGLGFDRVKNEAIDKSHQIILNEEDIFKLRKIYSDDVKNLTSEWKLDITDWDQDFNSSMLKSPN